MNLEELIYNRLIQEESLIKKLTTFQNVPAIFYQQAPSDVDEGWDKKQYPRIDYVIDTQADAERKTAGIMQISIWSDESSIPPEEIEPVVRSCLKDIFVQAEETAYCFAWSRTDVFDLKDKDSSPYIKVYGIDLTFDMFSFSSQITYDPDPILAMSVYLKKLIPNATQIGIDYIENYFKASVQTPAFSFSLDSVQKEQETYTVTWLLAEISIHVFAANSEERLRWTTYIMNQLSATRRIIMLDNSPMDIKEIKLDNKLDYLTSGQLKLVVRFGLLKYIEQSQRVQKIELEIKKGDKMNKKEEIEQKVETKIENNLVATDKSKYQIVELAEQAERIFDTKRECVLVALKATGKDCFTVEEAKNIIRQFLKKEVK